MAIRLEINYSPKQEKITFVNKELKRKENFKCLFLCGDFGNNTYIQI